MNTQKVLYWIITQTMINHHVSYFKMYINKFHMKESCCFSHFKSFSEFKENGLVLSDWVPWKVHLSKPTRLRGQDDFWRENIYWKMTLGHEVWGFSMLHKVWPQNFYLCFCSAWDESKACMQRDEWHAVFMGILGHLFIFLKPQANTSPSSGLELFLLIIFFKFIYVVDKELFRCEPEVNGDGAVISK